MARRGRPTVEAELNDDERDTLERWERRPKSEQSLALRCRIVLACAEGLSNTEVARALSLNSGTASMEAALSSRVSTVCTTSPARRSPQVR